MIRNITGGQGINVSGTIQSAPYINTNIPSAGIVRYINGNFEVYDGSAWWSLQSSYPTIELAGDVQVIVNWARAKMVEEERMKALAAKHPTVADALAARDHADEAVRIAVALCDTK